MKPTTDMPGRNVRRRPHIGRVVQRGVAFDPKNGSAMRSDDLLASVDRFFEQLRARDVDYVLVGGVAMLQYVEGRNTQDLDLIARLDELESVPGLDVRERSDPNFARATFEGLQIDVLRAEHPLFAEVRREHSTERRFAGRPDRTGGSTPGGHSVRCATVEGLLLLKLFALPSLYRQGDLTRAGIYESDIAALLYEYNPDFEPLFEALRPHLLDTDLGELHSIVREIRGRAGRFDECSTDDD